jgi:pleiotropic regulator 1
LTRHAKAVRAVLVHPTQWSFVSASQDAVIKWAGAECDSFKKFCGNQEIVKAMAINQDDVFVTTGDDGTM